MARRRSRDEILRERDRLAPLLEKAFALTEDELRGMEAAAAGGGDVRGMLAEATDTSGLFDPLRPRTDFQREYPHYHVLDVLRDPEYFPLTCKLLYGIDLEPFQHAILKTLWRKPMVMLVAARGVSKSFSLALYAHLRLLFSQGSKIAIIGAAFRQSKVIFDYMDQMWHNAPLLRDLVGQSNSINGKENGPRRDVDRCDLAVGSSMATALPVGHDGSKIRGMRASHILADEFASIDEELFSTVVFGFAAVSANPVKMAREHRRVRVLRAAGLWDAQDEEEHLAAGRSNQVVLSGTADYAYGQFAKTYQKYRRIIYSGGRPDRLEELFPGGIPPAFDHRDYACIRLPVELLPPKYMDEKIIGSAQVKLSSSQYLREYKACLTPEALVLTDRGYKPIASVRAGDMVLTHRGRFRRVTEATSRPHDGPVYSFRQTGSSCPYRVTGDHPYWSGGEAWTPAGDYAGPLHEARLLTLSGETALDLAGLVGDHLERDGRIYARGNTSRAALTNAQVREIRSGRVGRAEAAARYGVSPSTVGSALYAKKPKFSVPRVVPLDHDFGLVLGYYAAEGSIGAGGRAASFSLDGHVGVPAAAFVEELSAAVGRVFGLRARRYGRDDNTVCVTVNNRLVADALRSLCPGRAGEKCVRPDVLFSNPELLRGFLRGYWNGDGHVGGRESPTVCSSTSPALIGQVRMALSHFGVPSSLRVVPARRETIRGRECDCRAAYPLAVPKGFRREFLALIGYPGGPARPRAITSDHEKCLYPVSSRTRSHYAGPVFNLEVEEDHSYTVTGATVHNCFPADSSGFYRRSVIESCTTGRPSAPIHVGDREVVFYPAMWGERHVRHVIGVDPASERDKLAVVVLALHGTHARVVHVWTTDRKSHVARKELGQKIEGDYYRFAAAKVRSLMERFPTDRIAVDGQGGGVPIMEALANPTDPGQPAIYPLKDPPGTADRKPTDHKPGLHVVEVVQFARADWTSNANHNLKADLEQRRLLFPLWDAASEELSLEADKRAGRVRIEDNREVQVEDTLLDVVNDIEELKDEMTSIVHTLLPSGRERWDVPEVKLEGGRKGRLRKDRYSALLMANAAARALMLAEPEAPYETVGGTKGLKPRRDDGPQPLYARKPGWCTETDFGAVRRKR